MGDLIYIILGVLGVLLAGIGVGGYARGRKARTQNTATLPPKKPPADEVVPPVPRIAPTPSEAAALDDLARQTDNLIEITTEREREIEKSPASTSKPDPAVVDFLKSQQNDK